MRLFVLLTIVLCIALPALSTPTHVSNTFYSSRSGQLALGFPTDADFNANQQITSKLFFSNPLATTPLSLASIKDTQVVDLISYSLGVSPMQMDAEFDRTKYPRSPFFSKPAAAFVAVIDGVSLSTDSSLTELPSVSIEPSYITDSSLSTLETIFSGSVPSTHGIIADSWPDKQSRVSAGSTNGRAAAPSFADFIANSESHSLIVTASSDEQIASILGTTSSHPNSKVVTPRPFNLQQISQFFAQDYQFQLKNDLVQVSFGTAQVLFQLIDRNDAAFINEIQSLISLVEDMTSPSSPLSDFTQDRFPDLLSVGFSSLKAFLPNSAKADLALRLVDAAIVTASERLGQAYSGRLATVVITIQPLLPEKIKFACHLLAQQEWVSEVTTASLSDTCPDLYISQSLSSEQIRKLSDQVKETVDPQGVSSYVHPKPFFIPNIRLTSSNGTSSNSTLNSSEIAMFQITLWTSIVLFLSLVTVLASIFCLTWDGYNSQVFIESNSIQRNMIIGYKE